MKKVIFIICSMLFILPFFWLAPGELEMGGDSNRLFLYDPGSYLQVNALYSVEPQGVGKVITDQNLLPFLILLQLLSKVLNSPYLLMTLLNSVKLIGSFIFVYLIVVELLSHHFGKEKKFHANMAGIVVGLFYTLSPSVGENMRTALLTHNQVFLNPMIFYLLLRLLVTHNSKYLWLTLLTTLVFSPNFSLIAPPPPFAFYPLAFLFLILYVTLCLKKSMPWKKLWIGLIFFLGIHAFHTIPAVLHILDPSSDYYARAFDAGSGRNEALDYFNATISLGKVSQHIFFTYSGNEIRWTALAVPFVVILGFLLNKKRQKALMLIAIFFFATLFLTSANITDTGVEIYRKLFYIPGFSMFRVFYGQWQWVYTFFYTLLFGYLLRIVYARLQLRYVFTLSLVLIVILIIGGWPFISGNVFKAVHWGSNNMTSTIRMNPDYEQALAFLKKIPDDGKIINFPFTDYGYQLIAGTNNGAYIGVSPTAYLAGKRDYSGYQSIAPFSEVFLAFIKEKNYPAVKRLLDLLNVKYIFYSADPKAYKDFFPAFPYGLFLNAVPDSKALSDFVNQIVGPKIFERGYYGIYEADVQEYLPHFYIPTAVYPFDMQEKEEPDYASFFTTPHSDVRIAFVERTACSNVFTKQACVQNAIGKIQDLPAITYKRINPVKYKIEVSGARSSYTLVFSDKFHTNWKLFISSEKSEALNVQARYFNGQINESTHSDIFLDSWTFETLGMKSIPENRHVTVNGYANAWLIKPEDASGADKYEIIVEMIEQRYFYYGLGITAVSLVVFMIYGIHIMRKT